VARPLLGRGSGLVAGMDFHLDYSPERVAPGNPLWTFVNTPKVVSGINNDTAQLVFDTGNRVRIGHVERL
jgi:UDP-N-acetyl-D-glucosamine dehydrogenase